MDQNKKAIPRFNVQWSGRQDLNLRPLAPHASALPSCATSRLIHYNKSIPKIKGPKPFIFTLQVIPWGPMALKPLVLLPMHDVQIPRDT